MPFVKFTSHRARDYGLRALDRKPTAYFSLNRDTGKGVYEVTEEEIAKMRDSSSHAHFTRLRAPHTDLMQCWE